MNPEGRKELELLAPAADADTAIEAILHGADAVYMGGPSHGARKKVANSIDDLRRVADFAHIYRARLYVTLNTIVYDRELKDVERLVWDIYRAGADALIVQDMSLLRMDLPPIALHASTQCDIRTPEKARFLQDAGFSQLVLARELTLGEIRDIREAVDVPLETFVHGALCVSYSGRCHASQATCGRSANRGECAQICRLPYTLSDATGRRIGRTGHFLSLKDFNASDRLESLIEAGASSFKIEGRLKETGYVKNVTALYRRRLDAIIAANPDKYCRSSFGESIVDFNPQADKSFNRGFTTYFLDSRRPSGIWAPRTPKSMGETITDPSLLHNGDGISFFDDKGDYTGVIVNGVDHGRIKGNRPFRLPAGATLHRTFDVEWQKRLARPTAERKIDVDIQLDETGVTATDTRGLSVRLPLGLTVEKSERQMDFRPPFAKLGNTPYRLRNFESKLPENSFAPLSRLTELRRQIVEALDLASRTTYPYARRAKEVEEAVFPYRKLTYADNVANRLSERFYREHGVEEIEPAMEVKGKRKDDDQRVVMTTRHCILRELGMCRKEGKAGNLRFPLHLDNESLHFELRFDCARCEMHLLTR